MASSGQPPFVFPPTGSPTPFQSVARVPLVAPAPQDSLQATSPPLANLCATPSTHVGPLGPLWPYLRTWWPLLRHRPHLWGSLRCPHLCRFLVATPNLCMSINDVPGQVHRPALALSRQCITPILHHDPRHIHPMMTRQDAEVLPLLIASSSPRPPHYQSLPYCLPSIAPLLIPVMLCYGGRVPDPPCQLHLGSGALSPTQQCDD